MVRIILEGLLCLLSSCKFLQNYHVRFLYAKAYVSFCSVSNLVYNFGMHISHGTRIKNINDTNGYGYATVNMIKSLERSGHTVAQNDPNAPVQIWFDQPHHWKWEEDQLIERKKTHYTYSHQYRIGYHPWESTKLLDDWVERMNKCDEIWTPSPLIAEWYEADGVKVPIYVYEHGVDPIWTPKKRKIEDDGIIKFLHVGGEAARKRADKTMDAFRKAFQGRDDVRLTLKMITQGWNIELTGKIRLNKYKLSEADMVQLYHDNHIYVYPSYGEGFGLTPLQALATGMPTITVPAWAPYSEFLDPDLNVSSELRNSPWSQLHPGKMFKPDFDELIDKMRYAADNYDTVQNYAHSQVAGIQKKYDWDSITNEVFDNLAIRINE